MFKKGKVKIKCMDRIDDEKMLKWASEFDINIERIDPTTVIASGEIPFLTEMMDRYIVTEQLLIENAAEFLDRLNHIEILEDAQ